MIRIDVGTASVQLDTASEMRAVNGDLDINYFVGDLLAATEFVLIAANRRDLAAALRKLNEEQR